MAAEYSVIIVTYNSAGWIRDCIASVLAQKADCRRLEVIVVDNASSDGSASIVRREFPEVVLALNEQNVGFAAAVNRGAAEAQCEKLLLLNPDASLRSGFFSHLNNFFEGHPELAIVGCALYASDGSRQVSSWKTPGLWTALLEAALPHELSLPLVTVHPNSTGEVETVSGACMTVGRSEFDRLGRFDERFFMYYEDFDLCIRARAQGIQTFYCLEADAVHHVRKSTEAAGEMFFLYVYESKLRILEKHESPAGYLLAKLIILAGIAIRIPAYALAGTVLSKQELLQLSKYHTFVLPKIAARCFL